MMAALQGATSATIDPVLPRPRIRRFMENLFTAETPRERRESLKKVQTLPCCFSSRCPRRLGGEKTLREHFRIHFREERVVQSPHHFGRVVFFNHESQINFRRALRDHADLHIL
jgi:hypothetical protein